MSQFDSRGIPTPHFPLRPKAYTDLSEELTRLSAELARILARLERLEHSEAERQARVQTISPPAHWGS